MCTYRLVRAQMHARASALRMEFFSTNQCCHNTNGNIIINFHTAILRWRERTHLGGVMCVPMRVRLCACGFVLIFMLNVCVQPRSDMIFKQGMRGRMQKRKEGGGGGVMLLAEGERGKGKRNTTKKYFCWSKPQIYIICVYAHTYTISLFSFSTRYVSGARTFMAVPDDYDSLRFLEGSTS